LTNHLLLPNGWGRVLLPEAYLTWDSRVYE